MRKKKMLKNKNKSTSKDFILNVSLGSGKREGKDLTVPEKKQTKLAASHLTETVFDRTYFIR